MSALGCIKADFCEHIFILQHFQALQELRTFAPLHAFPIGIQQLLHYSKGVRTKKSKNAKWNRINGFKISNIGEFSENIA